MTSGKKTVRFGSSFVDVFAAEHRAARAGGRDDAVAEGPAASGGVAFSEYELVESVRREVEHLFNTTNLASVEDLSAAPNVGRSILNFGLRDLARSTIDDLRVGELTEEIETALRVFEPRLAPGSIKARRDASFKPTDLRLRFVVSANVRGRPVDVPAEFTAEIELQSGKVKIQQV